MNPDPRRETVLSLILEWEPEESTMAEHLGLSPEQWEQFKRNARLPRDYTPREPRRPEPRPEPKPPEARREPLPPQVVRTAMVLGGRKPPLNPEERAEILRLDREEGLTQREIASRVGCAQYTVCRVLQKAEKETR